MAISYTDIENGLYDALAMMPGVPTIQNENERYDPVLGETYIRVINVPGVATGATLGVSGTDSITGLYSVNCFLRTGTGTGAINTLASEVVNHFNSLDDIQVNDTCVRINSVWKTTSITETDWIQIPIQVSWTTYFNRK